MQSPELQEKAYGVPRGSVLGSLLFIGYMNGIETSLNLLCFSYIYRRHNVLHFNREADTLNIHVQARIRSLVNCLSSNKLTLNVEKAEFVLFAIKKAESSKKV